MGIVFRILFILSTLAFPFLAGCMSTYNREAVEDRLEKVTLDNEVAQQMSIIYMPIKVAVFIDMETMDSDGGFEENWDWSKSDKKLIMSYLDNLQDLGYISEYFLLPDNADFTMQDINYLIDEAGKREADVLLTLRGIIWINSYLNPSSIFNLTILGAWLVPGSNRDAILQVNMDLWNVKDNNCVLTVKGEGVTRLSRPTFLIETEEAVDTVKRDTLRKILPEFKKRCREIKPAKGDR
ncbi:MAG TPA: hypothetical protein DET40_04155 [Lentisphaeria bacterium]|nr:MAG: hypothetical protein A2X45_06405 [Lentisphaerae bacterium GWF2_50_93]HCE42719.1 hypothetical protein [Lentisphaeria bacterium]